MARQAPPPKKKGLDEEDIEELREAPPGNIVLFISIYIYICIYVYM